MSKLKLNSTQFNSISYEQLSENILEGQIYTGERMAFLLYVANSITIENQFVSRIFVL